jgi:acyl-CoA thioester hydrolase
MYHAEEGYLAATCEWLNLHVDLNTRRVGPWPDFVLRALAEFTSRQEGLPYPGEAGRRIAVAKALYHAVASDG